MNYDIKSIPDPKPHFTITKQSEGGILFKTTNPVSTFATIQCSPDSSHAPGITEQPIQVDVTDWLRTESVNPDSPQPDSPTRSIFMNEEVVDLGGGEVSMHLESLSAYGIRRKKKLSRREYLITQCGSCGLARLLLQLRQLGSACVFAAWWHDRERVIYLCVTPSGLDCGLLYDCIIGAFIHCSPYIASSLHSTSTLGDHRLCL